MGPPTDVDCWIWAQEVEERKKNIYIYCISWAIFYIVLMSSCLEEEQEDEEQGEEKKNHIPKPL